MKRIILTLGILVIFSNMAVQYSFSYPPTIQEVTDGCANGLKEDYNITSQSAIEGCVIMFYQDMNSTRLSANSTYSEVKQKCTQILRDFLHEEPPKISVDTCVGGTLEDLSKQ